MTRATRAPGVTRGLIAGTGEVTPDRVRGRLPDRVRGRLPDPVRGRLAAPVQGRTIR